MSSALSALPPGAHVAVVGLGASGLAAAELLLARGASVLLNDRSPEDRLTPEVRALLAREGVTSLFGSHVGLPVDALDLVVISPGVPSFPALAAFEARGRVVGELELAWEALAHLPTAAIGGTNGKSTTTELVGAMLAAAKKRVFVGGNLGTPLSTIVPRAASDDKRPVDALVLEVSSFQSERMRTFRPNVAALLNITADHLDRYPSFAAYAAAKGRMFAEMTEDDVAVVPFGDAACLREAQRGDARIVTFGGDGDLAVTPSAIVDKLRGITYDRATLRLQGGHNANNVAAAIAVASSMGASPAAIREVLESFAGLPHRMTLVGTVAGVRYYDDSKGTNVGAAVTALSNLLEPKAVLIAGGRDKRGGYTELAAALARKGRAVVALGEAAASIVLATKDIVPAHRVTSMEEAVTKAKELAEPGDAVLLSPACSSYDMFRDYKHRGEVFTAAVQAYPQDAVQARPTVAQPLPDPSGTSGGVAAGATAPSPNASAPKVTSAKAKPKAEPTPKAGTKPKAEPKPKAETKPKAAPKPKAETKPKAATKPKATESIGADRPTPATKAKAKPVAKENPKANKP